MKNFLEENLMFLFIFGFIFLLISFMIGYEVKRDLERTEFANRCMLAGGVPISDGSTSYCVDTLIDMREQK